MIESEKRVEFKLFFSLCVVTQLFNIVVLVLYRNGDEGYFMGASYNKNHDAEALACGVFVGYMIYNLASIFAAFLDSQSVNRSVTVCVKT